MPHAPLGAVIAPALAQLANELRAAGVPATTDAGSVQIPGAWLSARTITRRTPAAATLRVQVHLAVGGGLEDSQALAKLGELLDAALSVIHPAEPVNTASALSLPAGGDPLPSFLLTTDLLVPTPRSTP